MMKRQLLGPLLFLLYGIHIFALQVCDKHSIKSQCSEGEICFYNICAKATPCNHSDYSDCDYYPSQYGCFSDYCQPFCKVTGQCVYGQVCSREYGRYCVYPVNLTGVEGEQFTLVFCEPGYEGTYEEMSWERGRCYGQGGEAIVYVDPNQPPLYLGEYCLSGTQCNTSHKVELNATTGELTIYQLNVTDQNYYYYGFYAPDTDIVDTGHKFEIFLTVYVIPSESDIRIEGLSEITENGSSVDLTCTVDRIKPPAIDMYWTFDEVLLNATVITNSNSNGTFHQYISQTMNFTTDDHEKNLECTVVLSNESSVTTRRQLNIG